MSEHNWEETFSGRSPSKEERMAYLLDSLIVLNFRDDLNCWATREAMAEIAEVRKSNPSLPMTVWLNRKMVELGYLSEQD